MRLAQPSCWKDAFASKGAAQARIKTLRQGARRGGMQLRKGQPYDGHAYKCGYCDFWHIGTRKNLKSRRMGDQLYKATRTRTGTD